MNGKVRALAALLAAVTLWSALGLAGDVDAAAPGALLRQALVGRELGLDGCPEGTSLPGRLVLRQSPVLLSLAGAAAGEKTPSADSEAPAVPPAAAPGDIDPGAIGEELVYADNGVPAQTVIPAHLSEEKLDEVQAEARKAYLALNCAGLSRCDFFVERGTGRVLCNELNTLPGFTPISMYPKLMEHEGYSYPALVDKLLQLALHRRKGAY